jgi:ABC-type dipeptide/oligopeptide/nickel transport system permease component
VARDGQAPDRFDQPARPSAIVAYLLVIVTFFIVINLRVDILYSILDPRVRLTETGT